MTTFLSVLFGTFIGNLAVIYTVGLMNQRAERKRVEQMQTQLMELQKLAEKENERIKKYAEMES
jgi:hypothetical protein